MFQCYCVVRILQILFCLFDDFEGYYDQDQCGWKNLNDVVLEEEFVYCFFKYFIDLVDLCKLEGVGCIIQKEVDNNENWIIEDVDIEVFGSES